MASLIECVPNFSEGRRPEVIAAIVSAIDRTDGVHVLDHTSDPSHNRSVVTFAGAGDAVAPAAEAWTGRRSAHCRIRRSRSHRGSNGHSEVSARRRVSRGLLSSAHVGHSSRWCPARSFR